jgi:tetratricopeptide (TPR) repeat protein
VILLRILILTLLLAVGLAGQELRIEGPFPAEVPLGGQATVAIVVGSPDAELGPLPTPSGLGLRAASVQELVDGRRWIIELDPRREGTLTIPPLSVLVGDLTLRTEPRRIAVLADEMVTQKISVAVEVPERVWVGQEFILRVVIDHDVDFVRSGLLQPFRTPLAFPLRVDVPWLDGFVASAPVQLAGADAGEVQSNLVLNGRETRGRVEEGPEPGRARLVIERRVLALEAGRLALDDGLVRLAYATRFEDDFIRGRIPRDRRSAAVSVLGPEIEIVPLPEAGLPTGFSGAVGRFSIEASLANTEAKRELEIGEQIRLRLRVRGAGSIPQPPLPPEDSIPGFRALGIVADAVRSPSDRDFLLDLEATAGVPVLGAIPWVYFDPIEGIYAVARSKTLPVIVRGPAAPAQDEASALEPSPRSAAGEDIIVFDPRRHLAAPENRVGSRSRQSFLALALGLPFLAVGILLWLRHRSKPESRARRAYLRAWRSRSPLDLGRWLALRLNCSANVAHDSDFEMKLLEAGAPSEAARGLARSLVEETASRYGGDASGQGAGDLRDHLEDIEEALRKPRDFAPLGLLPLAVALIFIGANMALAFAVSTRFEERDSNYGLAVAVEQDAPGVEGDSTTRPSAHFAAGRFAEARALLSERRLMTDAPHRALSDWRIADCFYREGRFAEALLYYRRSESQRPADPDLTQNIRLSRQALALPDTRPRGLAAWWAALLDLLAGEFGFALMGLLLTAGLVQLLLLRQWRRFRGWIFLALALILLVYINERATWKPLRLALVLEADLALRADPGPRRPLRRKIPAGTALRVIESNPRWMRVALPDGEEGWVRAEGVGQI